MKNYVVGILSMFENDLKLFKVTTKSEYEAVKIAMIMFNENQEARQAEIDWQNSEQYPDNYEDLFYAYEETPFNVIEI